MKKNSNNKLNIKKENGFTMQDLIAACFIIIIFVGIISTYMYSVYNSNIRASLIAQMTTYAVQILEDIDKISYDEVDSSLASSYYSTFSIPNSYDIVLEVSDYGENLEDVIKIIKLTISYTFKDDTEEFTVTRLKIRES